MVKATQAVCKKCKYRTDTNNGNGFICNYLTIKGHSRVFDDQGNMRLPVGYCDCFERGKAIKTGWTSDTITFFK